MSAPVLEGEVVIVGGGVAGLSCARALHTAGRPFTLVTEDLGGRLCYSPDGRVNYGAYFIGADYEHVARFVERGPRLLARRVGFGDDDARYSVFRTARHPGQLFALYRTLLRFGRHLHRFRERCLHVGQARALLEDSYLLGLYREEAMAFLAKSKLNDVLRDVLGEVLYAVGFCELAHLSAFELLHLARYLAVVPVYRFRVLEDALVAPFAERVTFGRVREISRDDGAYRVHLEGDGALCADTVVVATPPEVTAQLVELEVTKYPVRAWATHVVGRWHENARGHDEEVFPVGADVMAIGRQLDDSALVMSERPSFDVSAFFDVESTLAQFEWNPAFHFGPGEMWPAELAPGLLVAGDHNLCTLEDAALTGLYAANRILGLAQAPR